VAGPGPNRAALRPGAVKTVPPRQAVPARDRWDLTAVFASAGDWEKLYRELEGRLPGYAEIRGKAGESAAALRRSLDFDLAANRDLERLYLYAHLRADEDLGDQEAQGRLQRIVSLHARLGEASGFLVPEIQAVPPERMREFASDPALEGCGFLLEKILRWGPHTRSAEVEEVLAASGPAVGAVGDAFRQLTDADFRFGTVRDRRGEKAELSHGNFQRFLLSPSRRVRAAAYRAYYREFSRHRHGLAAMLAGSVRGDHFYARARGFSSCRAAALFGDAVGEEVYDGLVEGVRGGLPHLFDYLRFRRRRLGLRKLRPWDVSCPLAGRADFHMEYEEAVSVCLEALAPLGEEYVEVLGRGLREGWVDRYENRGKRSGAYSSSCFDAHPYILLNYDPGSPAGVYTLAHEAGHAMHSWFSNRAQPYRYHAYRIFVAEVASTCNELLLSRLLLRRRRDDPAMRFFILNRDVDNFRATLYRQTMFAEFELALHRAAEEYRPLTLEVMLEAYRGLLADYWGGEMEIDGLLPLECLRIPHFYSAFYVYQYATGLAAASDLASRLSDGDRGAAEAYVGFLSLGGSRHPLDALRAAGVDMASPEPVAAAVAAFAGMVRDLEKTGEETGAGIRAG